MGRLWIACVVTVAAVLLAGARANEISGRVFTDDDEDARFFGTGGPPDGRHRSRADSGLARPKPAR